MKPLLLFIVVALLTSVAAAQDTIGTEITSITTVSAAGEGSSTEGVAGNSTYDGGTFTVNFLGLTQRLSAFEIDGTTVSVEDATPAAVSIRRAAADDTREVLFYLGNFNQGANTFVFAAPGPQTAADLLTGNNLLLGLDNAFTNEGASVGDTPFNGNQGIERIDYVLAEPVAAGDDTGFVIIERGAFDGHDAFGIAAITAVGDDGAPTAFGALIQVPAGWGQTILAPYPYFVLNNGAEGDMEAPNSPTLQGGPQQLGGIVIRTAELAEAGTEIFGYALVGPDVTCTPEELVDVTAACYPATTGNEGGLDIPALNLGAVTLGM